MGDPTSIDVIAPILGQIPSGVFILTASNGDNLETGMLTSWVQQASFSPPMVSVAVNNKRYLKEWLTQSPQVVLNYVGESQSHFLKHFGKGFEPDESAFTGLEIKRGETGLPILSDALGYLEGRITQTMNAGDHTVYLVEIIAGAAGESLDSEQPMVHIRKNGLGY